ncbi:MAG: sugar ABC transporter ATP-binding protein [Treponemataceae bacterium]
MDTYLELKNITKAFPGVLALDNVSFTACKGEVHALCGENGAGKSTLMKIINGIYKADSGDIFIQNKPVHIKNPLDARHHGISMIFQECAYVPEMTVAESLFIGEVPVNKWGKVDWKLMHTQAEYLLQKENLLDISRLVNGVKTKLKYLSISDIQMLEILKTIRKDASVIIMDEPTSSIAKKEADILLNKILELKDRGKSIIYISHKMDELFKIADRITVFRDGKVIGGKTAQKTNIDEIVTMMVGRELKDDYPKELISIGDELLSIENFTRKGIFKNVNFNLRSGEIIGFAGLVGAGRTEVARAICGLDKIDKGIIKIKGIQTEIKNISQSIEKGIAMCSEDRKRYGLVLMRNIRENIGLPNLKRYIFKGFLHSKKEKDEVLNQCSNLQIKTPSIETMVGNLSGGNQQKVVLAKWLVKNPSVLILDEPTRGIDVGAKYEIYKIMSEFIRNQKKGIIMISSELPELLGMCDRIYIMCKGKITGEVHRKDFSQELIMQYAVGSIQ